MKRIILEPKYLIPTDCPRSLKGVLRFIPMLCAGKTLHPIAAVPVPASAGRSQSARYLVCSGNHRAAATFICKVAITADVIESDDDLSKVREGAVSEYHSVDDLAAACLEAAESGGYLAGGWEEYLRMITDSGVVGYSELDTARLSENALRRGPRNAP